jgi:formylglycine-generating enzyme required for sulfatase activity
MGVSWYEALAFCAWLNDTGLYQTVRLPREEEWEYAVRGTEGWRYAWGNQPEPNLGNYAETGIGQTSAVGLFPAGQAFQAPDGSGLYDMSGNVWEWTSSRWGKDWDKPAYTYAQWEAQRLEREQLEAEADMLRIIRGGSWDVNSVLLRCALRFGNHPHNRNDFLGFRIVNCP